MIKQSSEIGMFKQRTKKECGFTLIELLVVLFIFTTMILMIFMNTDFAITDEKKVAGFAQNVLAKIKLAKQTAVFQHTPIRLVINPHEFGFQKFQQQDQDFAWIWIENDSLLQKTKLDNDIAMQIDKPLELFPNGRFTPFKLIVTNKKNNVHFEIIGKNTGEMELLGQ